MRPGVKTSNCLAQSGREQAHAAGCKGATSCPAFDELCGREHRAKVFADELAGKSSRKARVGSGAAGSGTVRVSSVPKWG